MALKDWKKVRENQYETVFNNSTKRQRIYATIDYGKFRVDLEDIGDSRRILELNFKTKSTALRFAKAYMRSH